MNCEPIETKNAHDPDEGSDEEEDGKKGALMIRIGFGGILYYNPNKESLNGNDQHHDFAAVAVAAVVVVLLLLVVSAPALLLLLQMLLSLSLLLLLLLLVRVLWLLLLLLLFSRVVAVAAVRIFRAPEVCWLGFESYRK